MFAASRMRASIGSPSTFAQTLASAAQAEPERTQAGERLAPAAVVLAPVDERRVDAERDVVQEATLSRAADVDAPLLALEAVERRERVVAVEAEVAGEVVARAVGDDDERQVALDGDRGHARDRAVAARQRRARPSSASARARRRRRPRPARASRSSCLRRLGQLVRRRARRFRPAG